MNCDNKKCKNCDSCRVVKDGRKTYFICKKYKTYVNSIGLCSSFEPRKEVRK